MKDPEYIIAIGASAGGLEEINSFFDHTPLDGVSYIVVQHLSADFKSRMGEVLAKHSKLSVEEATEGILVETNRVYLIPHDKFMTIQKGHLYLREKEKTKSPHLTINTFFNSLALDCGNKAIVVVLSGLGSDGAEGLIAVKKAGGMVMARNPETSPFPSMPSKAIATGMVDFILEPASMPGAIEDYVNYEGETRNVAKDDDKNLGLIIDLIKQRSPLDFSDYKPTTILRRTKRRAAYHDFATLAQYHDFLKSSPEEIEALSKDFLISVTAFFRDKEAFDYIQKNVIPGILKKLVPNEELKLWVAGCATGEEVYSLAMLISEQLTGDLAFTVVKIFATDIDSAALIHAGKGIYQSDTIKNVSAERLKKHFIKEGDQYRIKPTLRKMAIFAQHDLVKNPPYCNMHFISCRNLLIYMAPVLQRKVFSMLLFGLKMDGYLFLGSSENPMPIIQNLEVVSKQYKIYRNIKSKRMFSFDAFSMPDTLEVKHRPAFASSEGMNSDSNSSLTEMMQVSLAEDLDYLALCIDEHKNVIKSYGNTSKFLLAKLFTTNLEKLLPKKLAMVFHTMSNNVIKTGKKATLNRIKVKQGDSFIRVNLSLTPIAVKGGEQKLIMVTFTEDKSFAVSEQEGIDFNEKVYHDQYTLNLEEELRDLKEKLKSTYEQLDASNENMQSFNEEMISANEEMQSTNEEMQSVNEELDTINSEYQLKNKELLDINDDLNNYFRSNINGQLFINNDLLLMKFSPGTVKQINLLETDIGRPLSNITTNIKFETIIEDIKLVLIDGTIITKEIETNNGKWYQVMTMPYVQQSDQKNSGAIVTFNDVTELKRVQRELDVSNRTLAMAVDAAEMGTYSIDVNTRAFIPSTRLKEIFGYGSGQEMPLEAAVARVVKDYQVLFTDGIENSIINGEKMDIEYPINLPLDHKPRWVRAIGNVVYNEDDKPVYFAGLLNDVTIHKEDEIRKNDFIAMASHELRTPLTTLQGYIQLIESRTKKGGDEFLTNSMGKVNTQVKKMAGLIDGFLNTSSFEAGKIYLNMETFELNDLLEEITEEAKIMLLKHHLLLLPNADCAITADRDKIGQVLNNLISNAVKYAPTGTDIEVSFKAAKKTVTILVRDQGAGIKKKDQERLFDRYYRVDNIQTRKVAGFGLGLYLSAEIVKSHKGKIWVESEMGKGSVFCFSLPV
ncbi:PAS domain-containing protein [Pedobacter sp. CCM 8938]|uniref:histidine kinase n=1 Tax=Pedobacter fastidiosus TaxID=2765361 RepID=A0ABR7KS85_9SPHI|nr:chemotaxis protein CheB [Pedobacter fastidiosus]MBC6110927.1 PAS domain-containing protein [Pedobacter fastidiosus]